MGSRHFVMVAGLTAIFTVGAAAADPAPAAPAPVQAAPAAPAPAQPAQVVYTAAPAQAGQPAQVVYTTAPAQPGQAQVVYVVPAPQPAQQVAPGQPAPVVYAPAPAPQAAPAQPAPVVYAAAPVPAPAATPAPPGTAPLVEDKYYSYRSLDNDAHFEISLPVGSDIDFKLGEDAGSRLYWRLVSYNGGVCRVKLEHDTDGIFPFRWDKAEIEIKALYPGRTDVVFACGTKKVTVHFTAL